MTPIAALGAAIALLLVHSAGPAAAVPPPAAGLAPAAALPKPLPGSGAPAPAAEALAQGLELPIERLRAAIGAPPAAGSTALEQDLAILRWLQGYRTPEMVASAWLLLDRTPSRFSQALGLDMTRSTPTINAGLNGFLNVVDAAVSRLKQEFRRPRPFVSHRDLQPCLPREEGYAFPSGHASWYSSGSQLLAALLPERRERLLAIGDHGGASRVMCGVHYPSDVAAARRLGVAAAALITASPQWQRFLSDPRVQRERQLILALPPEALPLLVR